MECDWCWWLQMGFLIYVVVTIVRFLLADSDLSLQWADKFGKQPSSLARKVVWITGASGGIGEHLSYEMAKAGCRLVLSARRTDELSRVKQKCLELGSLLDDDIMVLPLDVTKINLHKSAVDQILDKFKKIDIFVSNAGRAQYAPFEDTDLAVHRAIMELNVFATVSLTQLVLPSMLQRGEGHIAIVSSQVGKIAVPYASAYAASKHALQGYFDSIRGEVFGRNIKVTLLCPSGVVTDLLQNSLTDKVDKTWDTNMRSTPAHIGVERCARLCAVAIANGLKEAWIGVLPALMMFYFYQYMPTIARGIHDLAFPRIMKIIIEKASKK